MRLFPDMERSPGRVQLPPDSDKTSKNKTIRNIYIFNAYNIPQRLDIYTALC